MGYDMRWRKVDAAETAAVAIANARFYELVAVRDALPKAEKGTFNQARAKALGNWDSEDVYDGQTPRYRSAADQVHAAYDEIRETERSYFRLNITGMGMCCDLMSELGMTFRDEPHPDLPEAEAFGVTDDQAEAVRYPQYASEPLTDEVIMAVARYQAALDSVLSWHRKELPGIPEHKFSSNDGWIVTPVECESALRIAAAKLDELGEDVLGNLIENMFPRDLWGKWLNYLRGAITHDGFGVN